MLSQEANGLGETAEGARKSRVLPPDLSHCPGIALGSAYNLPSRWGIRALLRSRPAALVKTLHKGARMRRSEYDHESSGQC